MSNDDAVAHGIKSTAGVVTSAALVMVAVFGSFALASDQLAKQIGVGLAAAILIDATIIRAVLLPGHDEAARRAQLVPAQAPRLAAEARAGAASRPDPDPSWRPPFVAGAQAQQAQPSPRHASRPSLTATPAISSPTTGSSHQAPTSALPSRPIRRAPAR